MYRFGLRAQLMWTSPGQIWCWVYIYLQFAIQWIDIKLYICMYVSGIINKYMCKTHTYIYIHTLVYIFTKYPHKKVQGVHDMIFRLFPQIMNTFFYLFTKLVWCLFPDAKCTNAVFLNHSLQHKSWHTFVVYLSHANA